MSSATLKSRILFFARRVGYRAPQFILIGLLLLLLLAVVLMAQTGGGATLVGTIKDSTGSVVTAAAVKVVDPETSFLTQTTTQPDGIYYVPYLTPGNYRVTVSAPGLQGVCAGRPHDEVRGSAARRYRTGTGLGERERHRECGGVA
jgi:hypothetical protein